MAGIKTLSNSAPFVVLIGHNFYGSGNIGDDLMVDGFLAVVGSYPVQPLLIGTLYSKRGYWPMSKRFPQIHWRAQRRFPIMRDWHRAVPRDCWVGVGGTPFQLTSGRWSMRYLKRQLPVIGSFRHRLLIGAGAEEESRAARDEFASIAAAFDLIVTRDSHSSIIVSDLPGAEGKRIITGGDLANLSLQRLIKSPTANRSFPLGMVFPTHALDATEVAECKTFLKGFDGTIAWVANDHRNKRRLEKWTYTRFSRDDALASKLVLCAPSYRSSSLAELIAPYPACKTIMSGRYHGLLIAAWAGCRVAAIGHFSKVRALAAELDIPCAQAPLTSATLHSLVSEARTVPLTRLQAMAEQAERGVRLALDDVFADYLR